MNLTNLTAISPLDGRYYKKVQELSSIFSEYSLLKTRVVIEIKWLEKLSATKKIKEIPQFSKTTKELLENLISNFDESDAIRIKDIESTTNHDVKAVEYFLKEKITHNDELSYVSEYIHFACTSEDINNVAYALMLQSGREQFLLPTIEKIIGSINTFAHSYANQPMLARTHGQPASPTTVGKEFANFAVRLKRQYQNIFHTPITAKFNGAVGNYNAHITAYPEINWQKIAKEFIESFDINFNSHTTQIEPHDYMAELFHAIFRLNNILIDFCRDIWSYIAIEYFQQHTIKGEVGSSTMPHKVNPIDFENAEGNLGIANSLFNHFADKLPISRWQRDLSDSTVLRNIGVAFGHSLLAYKSIIKGMKKLDLNKEKIDADLNNNWQILAEAIQTVMRRHKIEHPYEKLKEFTRGKKVDKKSLHAFIDEQELPVKIKNQLKKLTPHNYIGLAETLSKHY